MRYILCLCLISTSVILGGCSRGQDDRDGQYVTDADGSRYQPGIPFQGSDFTTEAQKLLNDYVEKHRGDGAIENVKIQSAKVDASYTGILNGNFSFSGQAIVTITGVAPFNATFRERITGSLVPNNARLLDHWFYPQAPRSAFSSAYVIGLDPWRTALASETNPNDVGYRIAEALSISELILDLKDHADPNALDAWRRANDIASSKRYLINLPLLQ